MRSAYTSSDTCSTFLLAPVTQHRVNILTRCWHGCEQLLVSCCGVFFQGFNCTCRTMGSASMRPGTNSLLTTPKPPSPHLFQTSRLLLFSRMTCMRQMLSSSELVRCESQAAGFSNQCVGWHMTCTPPHVPCSSCACPPLPVHLRSGSTHVQYARAMRAWACMRHVSTRLEVPHTSRSLNWARRSRASPPTSPDRGPFD